MLLDYSSAWVPPLLLAGLLGLAATPVFKAADAPPIASDQRVSTLDGLRGFLALAVFFHHVGIYHGYLQTGVWRPPTSQFYSVLGPFGVAMFFMITGFLFWSQFIDRKGSPGLLRLYVGRVFRIGPLYLAAVMALVLIAFTCSGFRLLEPPIRVGYEVLRWAVPLGAFMGPSINAFQQTKTLMSVVWSLSYEWAFYASLAVTGLVTKSRLLSWLTPAVGFALSLAAAQTGYRPEAPFVALFCIGMLTSALRPLAARLELSRWTYSAFAGALLLIVLGLYRTAYSPLPLCLLGVAFFFIANGTTLFGLLTWRASRRLGNVSFGIYLLQILVLGGVYAIPSVKSLALISPLTHWTIAAVAALALFCLATAAHVFVERPGVALGRKFLTLFARQRGVVSLNPC